MTPRNLAERMRDRGDGFKRETFTLPLDEARQMARAWLERFPAAAYSSNVEKWRKLPDGRIESQCAGCRPRTEAMSGRPVFKLRKNRPWAPADDVRLRQMLIAGRTVPWIASKLHRTGGATRNRALLLGMSAADNIKFRHARNRRLTTKNARHSETVTGEFAKGSPLARTELKMPE